MYIQWVCAYIIMYAEIVRPSLLRAQNFIILQISDEEEVAENCRLRCEKQRIPFYRFSPAFDAESDVKVLPTETDVNRLCDLVLRAQTYIESAWESKMDMLVQLLTNICHARTRGQKFF